MWFTPRMRSRRRTLALLVVAASLLASLQLIMTNHAGNGNRPPFMNSISGGTSNNDDDPTKRRIIPVAAAVPFTSEELRYIRYGEGSAGMAEDDPRYLDYIRSYITRPTSGLPRQLKDKSGRKHFSQAGQSAYVDKRLHQRRDGFFLECGAVDGETLSNSLFFEQERNWTGLLVEANPDYLRTLLAKNRQAYVMGGCLSPTRQPRSMTFRPAGVFGGIGDNMEKTHADFVDARHGGKTVVTVQCFPLPHVLRALRVARIDYLSLDVEGPELEILRTIDFHEVRVDILTVEYRVITPVPRVKVDIEATQKKLTDLRAFFNDTGLYREVTRLNTLDVVFERTDLSTI